MRYVFVSAIVAILLASACGGSAPPQAAPEPSPTSSAIDYGAVPPEPVGPVPEGILLVRKESQSPTTFGIASDGSVIPYGKGVHYFPSPGGRHTAFLRGKGLVEPTEVVIITADAKETFAAKSPEHSLGRPSAWPNAVWSPEGSLLAYTLADELDLDRRQVHVVHADGSGRRQLTSEAAYYDVVGWTKDGQVLVYSEAGLVLMGAKCRTLPLRDDPTVFGGFKLSPDGRHVAFTAGDWDEGFEVWVVNVETGESRLVADMGQVANRREPERYVSAGIPLGLELAKTDDLLPKGPPPVYWSPDGSRIAYYTSGNDANGVYASELRVVNVESGLNIGVTQDATWQAAWSPDGRYLAEPIREAGNVVVLRPDGSTAVLDVRADQVTWSDGGLLVAAHPGGVSLVDPDSSETREVLTAEGDKVNGAQVWAETAIWSPDGRYLAFSTSKLSHRKANSSLYVLDAQTGDVTLIVEEGSFQPVGWLNE